MPFATEIVKSISDFRVLINIDSKDTFYSGRFSFNSFTPIGSSYPYDGRLLTAPSISINRDSNQFGILVFSSSGFNLNNADGYFDTLIENYNVIGATIRVYIGYEDLDISNYVNIYTGYLESVVIDEDQAQFSIADLRKRLQTGNSTDISFVDAVTGIENILLGNYAISVTSTYFDLTAWNAAKLQAYDVVRIHPDSDTVDAAIEDCVKSTMGFFFITGDGKYSYKMIDLSATSVTTISHYDVMNKISISYDSSEIIASVSVKVPQYPLLLLNYNTGAQVSYNGFGVLENGYIIQLIDAASTNVIRSIDHGKTFSIMASSSSFILYDPNDTGFVDMKLGNTLLYAMDSSATATSIIFKSDDYGSSWSILSGPNGLNSVVYLTSGTLLGSTKIGSVAPTSIYATSSAIYKSLDYGSTWSLIYSFSGKVITDIDSYNGSDIFIITCNSSSPANGAIYKSTDAGSSWSTVRTIVRSYTTGYNPYYGAICNPKNNNLYVYFPDMTGSTNYEPILISYDNGVNWGVLPDEGKSIRPTSKFSFDSNGDIYVGGISSGQYFSYKTQDSIADASNSITKEYLTLKSDKSYNQYYSDIYGGVYFYSSYWAGNNIYQAKLIDDYVINNTHKSSTYSTYGIDTLKHFDSILTDKFRAEFLASDLSTYFRDLHGKFSITVPMKYYSINVGDNVEVEIWRETTQFLGTKKCEVLGKTYNLDNGTIDFNLRLIEPISYGTF